MAEKEAEKDFTSISWETSPLYRENALQQLQNDFPYLCQPGLKKFFESDKIRQHYTAALRVLEAELKVTARVYPSSIRAPTAAFISGMEAGIVKLGLKVKAAVQAHAAVPVSVDSVFQAEQAWLKKLNMMEREKEDHLMAEKLNEEIAGEEGGLIECQCCYSEVTFESVIQCSEGHLFCKGCLQHYAEQTVFGDGKSVLKCMDSGGCTGYFPDSMLKYALPEKTFGKYQEQLARDAIKAAKLEIISCHACNFQVEMAAEAGSVLRCPQCSKDTCRLCGEVSHVPLKCSEVEKKGVTEGRLKIEEAMTKARVRECNKCKTRFYKTEGCNKMTCTCGAFMCYCCRKDVSKEMYKHFCQTPHCDHKSCNMCLLYTDSIEDDRRAMQEAGLAVKSRIDAEGSGGSDAAIEIDKLLEGGKLVPKKVNPPPPAPAARLVRGLGFDPFDGGGGDMWGLAYMNMQMEQAQARAEAHAAHMRQLLIQQQHHLPMDYRRPPPLPRPRKKVRLYPPIPISLPTTTILFVVLVYLKNLY